MTPAACREHWSFRLPPAAASTPTARLHLRAALTGTLGAPALDAAELCLSELVTNAVLHAGTPVGVNVGLQEEVVRLEVFDASLVVPTRLPHTRSAATGRGLALVATLARRWGADLVGDTGKVVWCEVPLLDDEDGVLDDAYGSWDDDIEQLLGETAAGGEPPPPDVRDPERTATVHLIDYPVRRGVRAREHFEALRRECQLLSLRATRGRTDTPARLLAMVDHLASQYAVELAEPERAKLEAFQRGELRVDLRYPARPEGAGLVRAWEALLAEMDQFCRDEALLTIQAPVDVLELQAWVVGEFLHQLAGEPPRPWAGPLD